MESYIYTSFVEDRSILMIVVDHLHLATGRVGHDDRCRYTCRSDLIGYHPGLTHVLEHQLKIKLLGEPDSRHDVILLMRMEMHDAPSF